MAINYAKTVQFEDTSGNTSITFTATSNTAVIDTGLAKHAAVQFVTTDQNLTDASNQIDVYFQTTYDNAATWVDIANLQFLDASGATNQNNNETCKRLVIISLDQSSTSMRNLTSSGTGETGVSFTADSKVDLPLGDQLRIRAVFANTTSSPSITFTAWANLK